MEFNRKKRYPSHDTIIEFKSVANTEMHSNRLQEFCICFVGSCVGGFRGDFFAHFFQIFLQSFPGQILQLGQVQSCSYYDWPVALLQGWRLFEDQLEKLEVEGIDFNTSVVALCITIGTEKERGKRD